VGHLVHAPLLQLACALRCLCLQLLHPCLLSLLLAQPWALPAQAGEPPQSAAWGLLLLLVLAVLLQAPVQLLLVLLLPLVQ
jgi:hypothetical protein